MKDKILFTTQCGIEQIICKLITKSNREVNAKIESQINSIWLSGVADKKKEGGVLYNGNTFRVEAIKKLDSMFEISIYPVKYKIFYGLHKQIDKINMLGKKYSPNNLAVGALLKTSDQKYIFCKQSEKAYANPGISIIGGIVEKTKKIKDILKANLFSEITQETGIPPKEIKRIKPLCFIQSKQGSIILFNLVELTITSGKALKIFRTKHDNELSELILVVKEGIVDFVAELGYLSLIPRLINRI